MRGPGRGRRWLWRLGRVVLATGALAIASLVGGLGLPPRPEATRPVVDLGRPGIGWVDAEALRRFLRSPAPPVVVDVREPREWARSHLPGAIRVSPGTRSLPAEVRRALARAASRRAAARSATSAPLGPPLVAYCTIGWRSGGFVEAVRDEVPTARNLTGGILAWANAGGALVDPDGRTVRAVDPHSPLIGHLFLRVRAP